MEKKKHIIEEIIKTYIFLENLLVDQLSYFEISYKKWFKGIEELDSKRAEECVLPVEIANYVCDILFDACEEVIEIMKLSNYLKNFAFDKSQWLDELFEKYLEISIYIDNVHLPDKFTLEKHKPKPPVFLEARARGVSVEQVLDELEKELFKNENTIPYIW